MEQTSSSPATSNAIRGVEQSGNIANQRLLGHGGLEFQHGNWEADKQKGRHRSSGKAKERAN